MINFFSHVFPIRRNVKLRDGRAKLSPTSKPRLTSFIRQSLIDDGPSPTYILAYSYSMPTPDSCLFLTYKMLRSQRIQILTEWKFLSKRELIRFFRERLSETKCRCSRICPLPEGGALLGKQARRIASWIAKGELGG